MKRILCALAVWATMGLTACADLKGPHMAFRTEPLPPVVISTYDADGAINKTESMREHQVDVATVLAAALQHYGLKADFKTSSKESSNNNQINLGGLSPDQSLGVLIIFAESNLNEDQLAKVRTGVANQLVYASNTNCSAYLLGLRGGQVGSRLSTDLLSMGFSLTGALVKIPETAKRMSAYAGTATAIGATIDRDVFSQQAAELIADAIVQKRDTYEKALEANYSSSYKDWPLGTVLANIASYHQECSVTRGMASMREVVVAREQTIQALRTAAVAVEQNGGDGKQVLAVMSGFNPSSGKAFVIPAVETKKSYTDDLDMVAKLAAQCGDKIIDAVKMDATKRPAVPSVECDSTKGSAFQKAAVTKYVQGMNSSSAVLQPLHDAVADAVKHNTSTDAPIAALKAAYAQQAASAATLVEWDHNQISRKRALALEALDTKGADLDAATVAKLLTDTMDANDPILVAVKTGVNGSTFTGASLMKIVMANWDAAYKIAATPS